MRQRQHVAACESGNSYASSNARRWSPKSVGAQRQRVRCDVHHQRRSGHLHRHSCERVVLSANVRHGIHSLGDVVVFESGADERNVLPKPVRCIVAAGKRRRRRLHRLFSERLVVHPKLRLRLRPGRHKVLQRRHAHGHRGVQHISKSSAAFTIATTVFLTGKLLHIFGPVSATATASSKARHRRRRPAHGTRVIILGDSGGDDFQHVVNTS